MIQSIYTSVNNANLVSCGKKKPIPSEPIPLLRNNYLGEYRTELERAKVRKNLGIADEASLLWGNIDGTIEDQKDLVQYVEQKWKYTSDVSEDINSVKDALDYALFFISQYEANTEEIEALSQQIELLKQSLSNTEQTLKESIDSNALNIETLQQSVSSINEQIEQINESIINIDVDKNISNWINSHLENSTSIKIEEDTISVNVSQEENNALKDNEQGLFVQDLSSDIDSINLNIEAIKEQQTTSNEQISQNTQSIQSVNEKLDNVTIYTTELSDSTEAPEDLGGIEQGTRVDQLKGKSINEILDMLIFPTTVRDLVYPQLYYEFTSKLVEVGTANLNPTLTFIKNDAGEETSREETLFYNDSPLEELIVYDKIGIYKYKGVVQYAAGEYLIDNKGEVTEKRIEAGSIETSSSVTATYPWYAGNTDSTNKQSLIPFNQSSGIITISLSGRAVIKLPGSNSSLQSFKVNGGLGYLDVDLTGWEESTEQLNDYTYKVWTKKDSYSSLLPHQINFTLVQ